MWPACSSPNFTGTVIGNLWQIYSIVESTPYALSKPQVFTLDDIDSIDLVVLKVSELLQHMGGEGVQS